MSKEKPSNIIKRKPGDLVRFETIRKEELGGICKTAGYALAKDPAFPRPFKLTQRTVLFSRSEVRQFVDSRRAL